MVGDLCWLGFLVNIVTHQINEFPICVVGCSENYDLILKKAMK